MSVRERDWKWYICSTVAKKNRKYEFVLLTKRCTRLERQLILSKLDKTCEILLFGFIIELANLGGVYTTTLSGENEDFVSVLVVRLHLNDENA